MKALSRTRAQFEHIKLQKTDGWADPSWNAPQTYSYQSPPVQDPFVFHTYNSHQPTTIPYQQQPFTFDFSHLFPDEAAARATASAYATAAQFAQQYKAQVATAPPVNPQVDQANFERYSQYLDILKNAYGIQLPGELKPAKEVQPQYQLSSFPTAAATTYQAGSSPFVTTAPSTQAVAEHTVYTAATVKPQSLYHVYQTPQVSVSFQQPVSYKNAVQITQQQTAATPQQQQHVDYPVTAQQTYGSIYTPPTMAPLSTTHSYETAPQPTYAFPPPQQPQQQQYPQNVQYPNPVPQPNPTLLPPQSAHQTPFPQPGPMQPQQPQVPPQTASPQVPNHSGENYAQQGGLHTPTYQTAAFSTYDGQPARPKPTVYAYAGPGQTVKPTYSTNLASQYAGSAEQNGVEANLVAEQETVGSVYGGENPMEPTLYTPHTLPQQTNPPTLSPTPPTTRPTPSRPKTTRPRPTVSPTAPPARPSPNTNKNTEMAVSVQALTKQIRRLPAVLYLDSRKDGSAELENMLRETYGLPLVAFYVDKIGKPQLAQKNLQHLTAHKGLPYLFICGTFIGSAEHIENYHKNGQIPQLVEYVCGDERKKNKSKKTSS
ncbi:unnamed protein product [Cylicocyclus nassatus]|uniref:Glutaredoxin domain-containing protein n=1 Tax=Cylicocyclus nassatus TaxID=53992 RepID=A0AA36GI95_CYLNA|nr:unnamed protein product [Cylicocyclus nassatus]